MSKPGFRKSRSSSARSTAGGDSDNYLGSSLFSQAQILHLMKTEFARARRYGAALSCVVLQVDRLPQLVDLYGSQLRIAVRQTLADLIRRKTRGSDLLGVANEDRMLMLLPETPIDGARLVVERLRRGFADVEVVVDGKPLALTLSGGISAMQGKETMFFDSLLAQAEAAVERAEQLGGDQVLSFGECTLQGGADLPGANAGEDGDDADGTPGGRS